MDKYEIGDYVEHSKFGVGKVEQVENGREQIITVAFKRQKLRIMVTKDMDNIIHPVSVEEVQVDIFERLPSSNDSTYITGSQKDGNLAIKCNFCDGGSDENHIGFSGVCSDKNIKYNIEVENKVWCNNKRCPCLQYHEGTISRNELAEIMLTRNEFVCYESTMLSDWMTQAGMTGDGDTKSFGSTVHEGAACLFTTRYPDMGEKDRFVFGIFLIDNLFHGNAAKSGCVKCNTKYHIELTPDEAIRIKFWNYYRNAKNPEEEKWKTGLYRLVSNNGILSLLQDLIAIRNDEGKQEVIEFMTEFCRRNNLVVPTIKELQNDRPICSFSCGDTYDIAVETSVHAHPVKSGFPSKISPYIMLRAKGGISESLYKVEDVLEINPHDKSAVQALLPQYENVISYIKKRDPVFGFKHTTVPYRFYVLSKVYSFEPSFKISPNPQGHRYLSFEDVGINPNVLTNNNSSSLSRLMTDDEREQIEYEDLIIEEELAKHALEGADRTAIVKTRVNQGVFRELLIRKYNKCCLCGADEESLLVASHIKPWADSTRKERVDVDNGLLLCPNHDKLFDRGYITFDEDGNIIISDELSETNQQHLNVNPNMKLSMSEATKQYMKYHRESIFINSDNI